MGIGVREGPEPAEAFESEAELWALLGREQAAADAAVIWLRLQVQQVPGALSGLVTFSTPDLSEIPRQMPVAVWPPGASGAVALRRLAEEAAARNAGVAQDAPRPMIAFPLRVEGETVGVAALELGAPGASLREAMRRLQWGAGWLRDRLRAERSRQTEGRLARASTGLAALAAVMEGDSHRDACRKAATRLAGLFSAERVTIGRRTRRRARIVAISHSADFGRRMNFVRLAAAAMDEAIDQCSAVLHPEVEGGPPLVTRVHAKLARETGAGHVLTVPLLHGGRHVGAVVIERSEDAPFSQDDIDRLEGAAGLLGPALEEKRLADRIALLALADAVGAQLRRLLGPRWLGRKLALLALLTLGAVFEFWTQTWTVSADAVLKAERTRAIVAQFDGYLREAPVRAGDRVAEGDLLAALDDRELALERLRWMAERDGRRLEYERALADRDRAAASIARTRIDQAEAQIALVEEQISRARLAAPFDGIVVSGDQSQSIGAGVARGEVLFEIAPDDAWRVLMHVDERLVNEVAAGSEAVLRLTSRPGETYPVRIIRVTPVAEVREGRNTFRVEGTLDGDGVARLRPGMEGVARIAVDERRVIWIWTRAARDWLRLFVWRWFG